jgi:hypothetical protein
MIYPNGMNNMGYVQNNNYINPQQFAPQAVNQNPYNNQMQQQINPQYYQPDQSSYQQQNNEYNNNINQ